MSTVDMMKVWQDLESYLASPKSGRDFNLSGQRYGSHFKVAVVGCLNPSLVPRDTCAVQADKA